MQVYVVMEEDGDGGRMERVFASQEAASIFVGTAPHFHIDEWEVEESTVDRVVPMWQAFAALLSDEPEPAVRRGHLIRPPGAHYEVRLNSGYGSVPAQIQVMSTISADHARAAAIEKRREQLITAPTRTGT